MEVSQDCMGLHNCSFELHALGHGDMANMVHSGKKAMLTLSQPCNDIDFKGDSHGHIIVDHATQIWDVCQDVWSCIPKCK